MTQRYLLFSILLLAGLFAFALPKQPTDRNLPSAYPPAHSEGQKASSFYALQAESIEGKTISFERYKGQYVLIVNTASKCGFTPQYEDLQELHESYGEQVTILGFPCNQFGKQEPGDEDQIKRFCEKNYGVAFQMFSKVDVKGSDQHPVYEWLSDPSKNAFNDKVPSWNFCKYVITPEGKLQGFYPSTVKPGSRKLNKALGIES